MAFARKVLLSIDAKEGIKLTMTVHIKSKFPSLVAWFMSLGIAKVT